MRDIRLSSLRICLEVLRRQNLTAAAQALNMTQSAVSKNVQQVEAQLGVPLFERSKDGVIPYDNARIFLSRIAEGIGTIDAAVEAFVSSQGSGTLRIVAPPIIAQRFLIPFHHDLVARHPDQELVFRVRTAPGQRYADTDAEIFFNGGGSPPPSAQWLIGDRFWVVAHPSIATADLALRDIVTYPLLQHVKVEAAWFQLAERHGISLSATRFHYYEQYGLIIDAALQKLGIAIVPRFLVRDAVQAGQLQRIGEEIVFPEMGYYYQLVRHEKLSVSRKFFTWLKEIADAQA
ncbi:LysR family transcriptional regulator [Devosia sp. Root436]|uniref:LysR family transcriptional regulator n=1 Tax=Devosia sp. Root436 TaxID=1736537 RepID=UPI000ADCEAAA|nr:LysR family transcriptional regulator [Devosia sp. Root436]